MLCDVPEAAAFETSKAPRHAAVVRVTHWITAVCFFAMLLSGAEIAISHRASMPGSPGRDRLGRAAAKDWAPPSRKMPYSWYAGI
jgi:hypothetical protein